MRWGPKRPSEKLLSERKFREWQERDPGYDSTCGSIKTICLRLRSQFDQSRFEIAARVIMSDKNQTINEVNGTRVDHVMAERQRIDDTAKNGPVACAAFSFANSPRAVVKLVKETKSERAWEYLVVSAHWNERKPEAVIHLDSLSDVTVKKVRSGNRGVKYGRIKMKGRDYSTRKGEYEEWFTFTMVKANFREFLATLRSHGVAL
jgi:hypothetical protein